MRFAYVLDYGCAGLLLGDSIANVEIIFSGAPVIDDDASAIHVAHPNAGVDDPDNGLGVQAEWPPALVLKFRVFDRLSWPGHAIAGGEPLRCGT